MFAKPCLFPFCCSHPWSASGQECFFPLFSEGTMGFVEIQYKLLSVSLPGPQTWLFLIPGSLFPWRLALHAARLPGRQLCPILGCSVMCLVVPFPSSRCHLASCSQTWGRGGNHSEGMVRETWGHPPGYRAGCWYGCDRSIMPWFGSVLGHSSACRC